jgi:hypothetical protein
MIEASTRRRRASVHAQCQRGGPGLGGLDSVAVARTVHNHITGFAITGFASGLKSFGRPGFLILLK